MENLLYHAYLPEQHDFHVPIEVIMKKGINHSTKSNNWYGNGGKVEIEITEKLRPSGIPSWVDFRKGIGVDLTQRFSKSFCFPIFTDKILVFDGDVSLCIYDQAFYEDLKYFAPDEGQNFDTGKPIKHWVKLYWESMITLEEYLKNKPYLHPQVLIFESIPKEIIQLC